MEKDESADGSAGRRGEADLTGWIRLQMASGLRSSGEIVEALLAGAAGDRLPDADWESAGRESAERRGDERAGDERASGLQAGDELLGRGELEELVARVAAQYREQQPGPSADAQALVSAARGLTTIGLLVALGDEEDETLAREAALRRAAAARAGGAIITGCVYASRAAVEDMVLLGRLELGVAALEEDEHSAVGRSWPPPWVAGRSRLRRRPWGGTSSTSWSRPGCPLGGTAGRAHRSSSNRSPTPLPWWTERPS